MSKVLFENHLNNNDVEQIRFAKLKSELLAWGEDSVQEFVGHSVDISKLDFYELNKLMDEAYAQMPEEELEKFYKKFMIDKILENEENLEILAEMGQGQS